MLSYNPLFQKDEPYLIYPIRHAFAQNCAWHFSFYDTLSLHDLIILLNFIFVLVYAFLKNT